MTLSFPPNQLFQMVLRISLVRWMTFFFSMYKCAHKEVGLHLMSFSCSDACQRRLTATSAAQAARTSLDSSKCRSFRHVQGLISKMVLLIYGWRPFFCSLPMYLEGSEPNRRWSLYLKKAVLGNHRLYWCRRKMKSSALLIWDY